MSGSDDLTAVVFSPCTKQIVKDAEEERCLPSFFCIILLCDSRQTPCRGPQTTLTYVLVLLLSLEFLCRFDMEYALACHCIVGSSSDPCLLHRHCCVRFVPLPLLSCQRQEYGCNIVFANV
eukprot:RCo014516